MAYSTLPQSKRKGDRPSGTGPDRRTTLLVPEDLFNRAAAHVAKFKPGYGPRLTLRQLFLEGLELRLAQLEKQS